MKIYHVSKNLLDITDSNHGMYINDEGEMVYNPAWDTSNYIEVSGITGLTYSLISNTNGSRDISINEYSSDYTFIGVQSSGTIQRGYNSFSATLDSNTKYVRVSWINSEETSPDTEIMLNKGLTAEEYEPYGNTWEDATVKKSRKSYNLFDSTTAIEGNGIRAAVPTSAYPIGVQYEVAGSNCSPYVAVSPNTTYTITYPEFLGSSRTGLVYYSGTTEESTISGIPTNNQTQIYTFTTPESCNYIRFTWKNTNGNDVMLNEGSTALPYEDYGKVWDTTSYRKYGTETEIFTTLPHEVIGDGQSNLTWSMDGNMQVNGTPTSQNPITPQETGEKTANLLNVSMQNIVFYNDYPSSTYDNFTINNNVVTLEANEAAFFAIPAKVEENTTYYIRAKSLSGTGFTYRVRYYSDLPNNRSDNFISSAVNTTIVGTYTNSITTPQNCKYILTELYHDPSQGEQTIGELMVGTDSTDYEPFGYKIPITLSQNTYNIYITEPLRKSLDGSNVYDTIESNGTLTRRVDANGDALATPTTEQVTVPTLTTTGTAEQFNVLTTLAPSEVSLTYHGWHEHD